MSQTISADAINRFVIPALAEAMNESIGDDMAFASDQLEALNKTAARVAVALETIAGHLAAFNPN